MTPNNVTLTPTPSKDDAERQPSYSEIPLPTHDRIVLDNRVKNIRLDMTVTAIINKT